MKTSENSEMLIRKSQKTGGNSEPLISKSHVLINRGLMFFINICIHNTYICII